MEKNYETELPSGYREVMTVDVKDTKTALIMNLAALAITAALAALAVVIMKPKLDPGDDFTMIAGPMILLVSMIAYIVLHELVHGAAYKLLTGRKLTFGITFSAAYCGVPDIYVYRKTALISLLAPFVVFNAVFLLGAVIFRESLWGFGSALMLAVHFGGCAGDLYDTALYLTRFKSPQTLMRDTGPKQSFYLPENTI